jgi:hypothetical protein
MKPVDKIVFLVAATISAMFVVIMITPLVTDRPLSSDKAQIVGNLISSLIAILSLYVGAKLSKKDPPKD